MVFVFLVYISLIYSLPLIKYRAKPIKTRLLNKVKHCVCPLPIATLCYFIGTEFFVLYLKYHQNISA